MSDERRTIQSLCSSTFKLKFIRLNHLAGAHRTLSLLMYDEGCCIDVDKLGMWWVDGFP